MKREEFTRLAETYMDMVFRIAVQCLGNRTDAEDVVQNVMLRLFRFGPDFESEEHAKHWLCRVTINESRRLASRPWRKKTVPLDEELLPADQPEQQQLLDRVLELPARYRLPLYLYYYEEYSVAQIGKILGRGESTIQTQLARGRALLREKLTKEE